MLLCYNFFTIFFVNFQFFFSFDHFLLPLNALEFVFVLGGHKRTAAPGSIHVQPHVVFFAKVGDFLDGVERAQHGGAGGGEHHEGSGALGLGAQHLGLQVRHAHAADLVDSHSVHVVGAEAEKGSHLLD